MYKVKILRTGKTHTCVSIEDYQTACRWAMARMKENRALDGDGLWAAVIESGVLLWDPLCEGPDIFLSDGNLKEGLVLDKKLLHDPKVDVQLLFGQSGV